MTPSPELAFALVRSNAVISANPSFLRMVGAANKEELAKRTFSEWMGEKGSELEIVHEDRVNVGGAELRAVVIRNGPDLERRLARTLLKDRMISVGTLAAGVAHEINNPLSYVIGNLSFVSEEAIELLATRQDLLEALTEAREGADRVRQIVRDLQMFARADHQSSHSVDVRRTVELAINMAWIEIRHRARLVKEFNEVSPVEGSEARLGQVFLSLLLFAAQALPEGVADKHTIRVTTRQNDKVIVEVADTGPGLAPDIKQQLFDPFAATGVGLAIAQTIVHDLGGFIEVETAPGTGTLFRVHLPKTGSREQATEAVSHVNANAPIVRGRVLVVDDEPLIASSLKRALREHDVTIVGSGKTAIELLERDADFDLIFCDLMMPEKTGMDVYDWLEQARPGVENRVVFITGGTFTERAAGFLQQVKNARFEKPFDLAMVRAFVRERLSFKPSASDT